MAEKIVKDSQCLVNDLVNDTISRQAAVDAIQKHSCNTQRIIDAVEALPSAQPEKRTYKRSEMHACDLISRAEAIDYFVTNVGFHDEDGYPIDDSDELRKIWTEYFDGIPSAQPSSSCGHEKDAQSVRKRGKWIHYEGYLICSECRTEYDDDIMTHCCDDVPKFCPNCGADMREGGKK